MQKVIDKFKGLSTLWKVIVIALFIVISVWIFDSLSGYYRDIKNSIFDSQMAKVEETNKVLIDENAKLREQIKVYEAEVAKLKIKEEAVDNQIEKVGGQLLANKEKTEALLKEVEEEAKVTNEAIDAKIRCERLKAKMIALKIPSAGEMNCENVNN